MAALAAFAVMHGSVRGEPWAPAADHAAGAGHQLSLEQLGAQYPFQLKGVDASAGAYFDVRADEVVTQARLKLGYTYSPALISELSHINVLLNDVVAASLPVPRADAGKFQQRTIELPAHLVTESNRLRLQLIGHYTLECEDPLHSSLWANISNKSTLELAVERIVLPDDLSMLPLPFFDHRDQRRLELPFVFSGVDAATLEAAGTVASWFGALAGYRGASFPVRLDGGLPAKGNAVAFGLSPAKTPGPTLRIAPNPNDPYGKILYVQGRDGGELKRAARALSLGYDALVGPEAAITQLDELQPRKPYDAPNWLRTDRPVKFGELVSMRTLEAPGYRSETIRIPLRLPPDLFGWRAPPVPMDLRYRYSPQAGVVDSTLLFDVNEGFLRSFPLLSVAQLAERGWAEKSVFKELLPVRVPVEVPLERLMRRSELQYRFMYDYIKEGECRDVLIDNVRGRIDPESSIDLRGYPHFLPMPDLAAFSDSGFPFTRMADLSETGVVFQAKPAVQDIATYLTLMGRFGESTGHPATAVSVAFGKQGLEFADKDLVVISSGNQSWLAQFGEQVPAMLDGARKRFDTSDLQYRARDWMTPDPRDVERPVKSDLRYDSAGFNAIFAGFESPLRKGRSVVLISAGNAEAQRYAADALLGGEGYEQKIQGSLVVVHEKRISPLVAEYTYAVGSLGPLRRLEWTIAQYWPGVPPLRNAAVAAGALLAVALLLWLRKRLKGKRRTEGA
ncbi:cellulose biosynthesis cyclic di-GMP-binding regulatory protein BcsB [Parapusillimonas granuli]|nr:cellulose biosynthesis cyclic di-GMP-binding regulatory protein BcsB [Parapusillimonas granuli]MBB5216316.1 hypothetical protein [Parapusillimonas granuli]MEB2401675.1 cellulose biosynthesis cyclic di-GMP-binding regulatory protein BcsB [Alcaligenaceae bacterium]